MYLLDDVKFTALRFAKSDFRADIEEMRRQSQKIATAIDYADEWKTTCIEQLEISESEMDRVESNEAEIGYAGFLQNQTSLDDWFSLYVITIPCIYVRTLLEAVRAKLQH